MDLLNCLCNDIQLIVYRYLFGAMYGYVLREYTSSWLREGVEKTHWDIDNNCFKFYETAEANWRCICDGGEFYDGQQIYTFISVRSGIKTERVIPKNYEHAQLFM